MSTVAAVTAAWNSAIWEAPEILAFTGKIFPYEITQNSGSEKKALYSDGQINFVEYVITRNVIPFEIGGGDSAVTFDFLVEIRYTREQDAKGLNFGLIRDFYDTLQTLVLTDLGGSWNSTVDYYEPQGEPPKIINELVADRECWRATYSFKAIQFTTVS